MHMVPRFGSNGTAVWLTVSPTLRPSSLLNETGPQ